MARAGIVVLSDKGARGERQDLCTDILRAHLERSGHEVVAEALISDDYEGIVKTLIRLSDEEGVEFICTSGGTGFSERDNTPEATLEVGTRQVPGIGEAMRAFSMQFTDRAMLSRATSVIRNKTLIVNLPGSPKALEETLSFILPPIGHGLEILLGTSENCARK